MDETRTRLRALEREIERKLPAGLAEILAGWEPVREGAVAPAAPARAWDVRTTYSLDDGDQTDQFEWVYDLIGDVLPPGAALFAASWGDDFHRLVPSGRHAGRVVCWSHEQQHGDPQVEPLADSFAGSVPEPPE